jgi:HAD superfamily hydrolase (TIGR01509 family)
MLACWPSGRRLEPDVERAVLWDLDGTLVDSEPLHEQTLIESLGREDIAAPDDLHERVVGLPATRIHAHFAEHHGLKAPFAEWSRFRCLRYLEQAPRLRPRVGALDLFHELQACGVAQAIVSNSDRLLVDASLRAIGLIEPDLVTVSRNDVRAGKPDPEPYLRGAWLLGVEAGGVTVIEDSTTGALAGIAAGMRTLFWPQDATPAPAAAIAVAGPAHLRALLGLA